MKKLLTLMLALVISLTLVGCGDKDVEVPDVIVVDTTEEDLADAVQKLSLDVTDASAVTANIALQASGLHDAVITWSSNNTVVITDAGVVTRPAIGAGDVTVVLTATVKVGDKTITKDFTVKVLELVPYVEVTIEGLNSIAIQSADGVQITGVIFAFIEGKGIQIFDETGYLYVFNNGDVDSTLKLGDKVEVKAEKANYYGLPQVKNPASITLIDSDNALPTYVATSTIALFDEDAYDTIYWSKPIIVSGMVKIVDGLVKIVETDADGMAYDISVYEHSNAAKIVALKALVGKVVTVEASTYGFHGTLNAWRVIVAENAVITSEDPTDAQIASYEAGQIDLGTLTGVMENLTLSTAGIMNGTTIAWASNNEAVITTAGVVTRISGDTTVVLTATVTVGSETATREFTVIVKDVDAVIETITVAEALLLDDDTEIVLKAVVAGFDYGDHPFFQDADGTGIFYYGNVDGVVVGDEVIVNAKMSTYASAGIRQIKSVELVKVVSQGNVVFVNETATPAEVGDATAIGTTQSRLYKMTLTVATLEDGAFTLFTGNGTSFFSVYTNNSYLRDILVDTDTITFTFFVTGKNDDSNIKVEIVGTELTAVQNLAAVKSMIDVAGDTTADLTLKTELTKYDAVITWASDNAAVTDMGVVTRPAIGAADTTVTLTASIVIGSETAVTEDYVVVVKANVASLWDNSDSFAAYEGTSSYDAEKTFTGDSSVSWTSTGFRKDLGDYTVDETGGIMAKVGTLTAAAIDGGISSLSIDLLVGFTGGSASDRVIEVYVNDVMVGTYTLTTMDTLENLTIEDINVSGAFKLEIKLTGSRQLVIDNLQWNGYTE